MRSQRRTQPRVIQIMPAVGWHAVLADENGEAFADPLIGWALVEIDEDNKIEEDGFIYLMPVVRPGAQAVVGLSVTGDGWIESPEDQHGFLGYSPPGEDIHTEWVDRAREHADTCAKARARKAKPPEAAS